MKDYDLKDNYYCYNGSIVLKNKFDIKDKKLLDSVEKDITGSILLLLQSKNFHKKEKYLIEYEYDEFIEKLSYFITELNIIHPFREGNGRVIREYFRILLERKNLFVDYSDKEKYLEAMIESPYNMNKLKQFLNNNLKKYWTVEITDFCWMMDVGGSRLEDSENLFCKFSVVGWLLFVVGKIKNKVFKKQKTKLPKC